MQDRWIDDGREPATDVIHGGSDLPEQEVLAHLVTELRRYGHAVPRPEPTPEMRAAFRAAVVAAGATSRASGAGRLRGAVLGIAAVAGGGMLLASAAGSTNPPAIIVDTAREFHALVAHHIAREGPTGTAEPVDARPVPTENREQSPSAAAAVREREQSSVTTPPLSTSASLPAPSAVDRQEPPGDGNGPKPSVVPVANSAGPSNTSDAGRPAPSLAGTPTAPSAVLQPATLTLTPTPTPPRAHAGSNVPTVTPTGPAAVPKPPTPTPTPTPTPIKTLSSANSKPSMAPTMPPTPTPTPTAPLGPASGNR